MGFTLRYHGNSFKENTKSKGIHLQPLRPMEALENASAFAQAYAVGRLESSAAINLLNHMSPSTRDRLKELVRPYTGETSPRFEI